MNDQFDELAKGMAQSVTRRGALKKFGVGLSAIMLASLGLANKAEAGGCSGYCKNHCTKIYGHKSPYWESCVSDCLSTCGI